MDWIERLFGVSPDRGDHSVEMSLLLSGAAIVSVGLLNIYRKYGRSRSGEKPAAVTPDEKGR